MRLLHVITGLSTGGAERALYTVLSGGLAARYEVAVISLRDEGSMGRPIRELGVPVHTLDMDVGLPAPKVLVHLRRIVHSLAPDVIQGWMYHGNLAANLAARFASDRPAVVWNVRHSLSHLKEEKLLTRQVIRANRFLSRGVDGIIYNSCLSRAQHARFGFDDRRARVIPNGFDLDRLRPDREVGQRVRVELDLPADALVIGHVARLHPMKDHASFLRAAVQVARAAPRARHLVVGRNVTPENPALAGIVPEELLERFVFTGERRDPERLMQAMDVVTSSSWGEAFPNVLGEAMACGVPCVTTDVGDSADIVGDTGIVVPPSDSGALAEGLLAMLAKDAPERERLGRAARERVAKHYTLPRIVERYAQMYREITG
jgi:glycosyltransferase involved in cell wall biosynthesis